MNLPIELSTEGERITVFDPEQDSIKFDNIGGSIMIDGRELALSDSISSEQRQITDSSDVTVRIIEFYFSEPGAVGEQHRRNFRA